MTWNIDIIGTFSHHMLCYWSCRKRIHQRLALYQGVCPIYMEFSDDAEETFKNALSLLQVRVLRTVTFVDLDGNGTVLGPFSIKSIDKCSRV